MAVDIKKFQFTPDEWKALRRSEWFLHTKPDAGNTAHRANVERVKSALGEFRKGKIKILAVHGSGRDTNMSCAHEISNSELLCQKGLESVRNEPDVEIRQVELRKYLIEPCNACYSSTSALCGFPCNCFPLDDMQQLYGLVLRSDILLMSTGVNQSAMSSRLKLFCDRLISLDGGYYVTPEQFGPKDVKWKNRMLGTSLNEPIHYDQRIFGRVCGFFISSKDNLDRVPYGNESYYDELTRTLPYAKQVADSLYRGFHDYGCYFADPWYAVFSAVPDRELAFDKERLSKDTKAHKSAENVVQAALDLARKFRNTPPEPRAHPLNRT